MKSCQFTNSSLIRVFILLLLLTSIQPSWAESDKKANIILLATGGTIAGTSNSTTNVRYAPSQLMVEQLIAKIPEFSKLANVKGEQFSQIVSQDMDSDFWLKLANRVNELAKRNDVDGIVITHGTDTLEETAYFLNLTVKTKKPIVLVGAMRPSTSISSDGQLNLYNAIALASSAKSYDKGVLVTLNDYIYDAREVTKSDTTNVNSFQGKNFGPIGQVYYGNIQFYYSPLRLHTDNTIFALDGLKELPRVDLIYGYTGQSDEVVTRLTSEKTKGLVFAGVGDGNPNQENLKALSTAEQKGIAIVRSSRVKGGMIIPNAEINDNQYNFITADNLSPQKARILLMLALTKTNEVKKIQKMFLEY